MPRLWNSLTGAISRSGHNDAEGRPVSSAALLSQGPLVLTFYRGVWCP
jgi:hypothetical protein